MKRSRGGFTLIELLIVIAILVILTLMVVVVYQANHGTDRMRAAARQVQSAILGARDRAIHAKSPRGIRLIPDSADLTTVSSFIYVSSLPPHAPAADQITIGRPDLNSDGNADDNGNGMELAENVIRTVRRTGAGRVWYEMQQQGLLVDGSRIRIPANGSWYTVGTSRLTASAEILILTTDFRTTGGSVFPAVVDLTYTNYILELEAAPTQGEQPISLPSAVTIDLDNSRLPGKWKLATGYSPRMDIMFSPRGTVMGPASAEGIIHLLLTETADVARNWPPEASQGEKLLVTVFTRTGAVSTHPVDVLASLGTDGAAGIAGTDDDGNLITDTNPETGLPDAAEIGFAGSDDRPRERFRFAETGQSAGK